MSQGVIQIPFYEMLSTPVSTGRYAQSAANSGQESATGSQRATRPFVVGEENKALSLISYEILQDVPNPLPVYLFAPIGSGKSHFVEGLFITWKVLHPGLRGELLSAGEFSSRLNEAARTQTMQEFQRDFHKLDFLVLEDFHQLAGKAFAQQELIHLLDKLRGHGARVVVTSSVALKHVEVERKLISRVGEGFSVQIQPPGLDSRLAILDLPENRKRGVLAEDARDVLVEYALRSGGTVYDMLSTVQQLDLKRRSQKRRKITPEDVEAHYRQKAAENGLDVAKIARVVGRYYSERLADMRSKSRRASLVAARGVVYYLARKLTDVTLAEIGAYFDGRDHTTILHGIKFIESSLAENDEIRDAVEFLMEELRPSGEVPVRAKSRGKKK